MRFAPYLTAGLLAVYLCFLTQSYFWDGVMFSWQIEQVFGRHAPFSVLFHANHLLYSSFGYLLYAAAAFVRLHLRAIVLLQIWNAIVGAFVVYRIYSWLFSQTASVALAGTGTSLFAFGATWWKFATDADPYIISVYMLVIAILCVMEAKPRLFAAALCHIAAMLFHQLAVFGYLPILVAIMLTNESTKRRLSKAVVYCTCTGACVFATYEFCYRAGPYLRFSNLFRWLTDYAGDTQVTHSAQQIFTEYITSWFKLFLGGKFSAISTQFSVVTALSLVGCAAATIWCIKLVRNRNVSATPSRSRRFRLILWSWFVPLALFLAWFDPGNAGHKLFVWPCIVLLLFTATWVKQNIAAVRAFVAALIAWNFGMFIYPHSRPESDPVIVLAKQIDQRLPRSAVVYYDNFVPDDWYLDYFAPDRNWEPQSERKSAPAGSPVCFDTTALSKMDHSNNLDPHLTWELRDKQHYVRLACLKQPE